MITATRASMLDDQAAAAVQIGGTCAQPPEDSAIHSCSGMISAGRMLHTTSGAPPANLLRITAVLLHRAVLVAQLLRLIPVAHEHAKQLVPAGRGFVLESSAHRICLAAQSQSNPRGQACRGSRRAREQ